MSAGVNRNNAVPSVEPDMSGFTLVPRVDYCGKCINGPKHEDACVICKTLGPIKNSNECEDYLPVDYGTENTDPSDTSRPYYGLGK